MKTFTRGCSEYHNGYVRNGDKNFGDSEECDNEYDDI
jgi:hypothetical protein